MIRILNKLFCRLRVLMKTVSKQTQRIMMSYNWQFMKKHSIFKLTMFFLTLSTSIKHFIELGIIKNLSHSLKENSNKQKVNSIKTSSMKNISTKPSIAFNVLILSKWMTLFVLTVVFKSNCLLLTSLFSKTWMPIFQILFVTEDKITVNGMLLSSKNFVGISYQHLMSFIKIISLTMI